MEHVSKMEPHHKCTEPVPYWEQTLSQTYMYYVNRFVVSSGFRTIFIVLWLRVVHVCTLSQKRVVDRDYNIYAVDTCTAIVRFDCILIES